VHMFRCGHLSRLSLAILLWVGAMSTSQRAVTPCSWGVKTGMVRVSRVWVAGKNCVIPLFYTRVISEHFRDKGLTIKRYINSTVYFTLLMSK